MGSAGRGGAGTGPGGNIRVPGARVAFHGFLPKAFHARVTDLWLIFTRSARSQLDQCVTGSFFGGGVSVAVTTAV